MEPFYIVVQFAGEYGNKADALIRLSKGSGSYWTWETVSDDDKILSFDSFSDEDCHDFLCQSDEPYNEDGSQC